MLRKAKGVKTELSKVASFPPAVECGRDDDEPSGYLSLSLFLSLSLPHTHTRTVAQTHAQRLLQIDFCFRHFSRVCCPPFWLSTLPLYPSTPLLFPSAISIFQDNNKQNVKFEPRVVCAIFMPNISPSLSTLHSCNN